MAIGGAPLSYYRGYLYSNDFLGFLVSTLQTPLLATASAAIVGGLLHQAYVIRQKGGTLDVGSTSLQSALRCESTLRLMLAATIAACVTARYLREWQLFKLPMKSAYIYEDLLTDIVWKIAVLIAMADASIRAAQKVRPRRRLIVETLVWAGCIGIAIYIATNGTLIAFLVHVGCRGVDAADATIYNRYGIPAISDEWRILLAMSVAAACAIAALVTLSAVMSTSGLKQALHPRVLGIVGLLLSASGAGIWFYSGMLSQFSPDIHSVSFEPNWWECLGGAILAALLVTYSIYRFWHASSWRSSAEAISQTSLNLPPVAEGWPVLLLLLGVALIAAVQIVNDFIDFDAPLENIGFIAAWPSNYFTLAMLFFSLNLLRLRWQGKAPGPLPIVPLQTREFAGAWLLLAAIVAVAIPTFAAFSFSFWLGPWYRW
ncbi:hypothetical protein [Lacipirellula sp.]|uniref:hypothetical protein n=1 Tax=Lacipirellula sp. TaxID=2691419 RepID=UPI003D126907